MTTVTFAGKTKLLERCAVKPLVEVRPGTVYGYAFPGRIVYHQDAAEWSWARIFAMFERQIAANPSGGAHNPETV
jgi:hypothetical protein